MSGRSCLEYLRSTARRLASYMVLTSVFKSSADVDRLAAYGGARAVEWFVE
jgi:hypothetical protein